MPTDVNSLLKGFEIVPSDSQPFITLDNNKRFYLNSAARRRLDASPNKRMALAYNPSEKALALINPHGSINVFDMSMSQFNVDKRYYMSARHFSNTYGFEPDDAPYVFEYDRGDSNGNIFIFRLANNH